MANYCIKKSLFLLSSDVGGCKEQIDKLREVVETPLLHPERFVNLGIEPPKGVLLYGPPGTGKTLCARAVANRTDACFIRVIGSELVQKVIYILDLAIEAHFIFLLFNPPSPVHLNYALLTEITIFIDLFPSWVTSLIINHSYLDILSFLKHFCQLWLEIFL